MRKYILGVIGAIGIIGCSGNSSSQNPNTKDSVTVHDLGEYIVFSLDSFKQIKDSFVYVNDSIDHSACDGYWCTKEYYKWNFGFPDTIKVAFTRNGVFEDSVEAVRQGLLEDSKGNYYSPAYIYGGVVGDNWVYDANGKFVEFNCVDLPHSGAPHHYKP